MEVLMKNPERCSAKTFQGFGSHTLGGTDPPGSACLICGCDEVRDASRRDDERQLTPWIILSLDWGHGTARRNWSDCSVPSPDLALSHSRCRLWSCHHRRSDCHVHTDGLGLAPSLLGWHGGGFHCVWPLQDAADSAAPLMRFVFPARRQRRRGFGLLLLLTDNIAVNVLRSNTIPTLRAISRTAGRNTGPQFVA